MTTVAGSFLRPAVHNYFMVKYENSVYNFEEKGISRQFLSSWCYYLLTRRDRISHQMFDLSVIFGYHVKA